MSTSSSSSPFLFPFSHFLCSHFAYCWQMETLFDTYVIMSSKMQSDSLLDHSFAECPKLSSHMDSECSFGFSRAVEIDVETQTADLTPWKADCRGHLHRAHGFFCMEGKKCVNMACCSWEGNHRRQVSLGRWHSVVSFSEHECTGTRVLVVCITWAIE